MKNQSAKRITLNLPKSREINYKELPHLYEIKVNYELEPDTEKQVSLINTIKEKDNYYIQHLRRLVSIIEYQGVNMTASPDEQEINDSSSFNTSTEKKESTSLNYEDSSTLSDDFIETSQSKFNDSEYEELASSLNEGFYVVPVESYQSNSLKRSREGVYKSVLEICNIVKESELDRCMNKKVKSQICYDLLNKIENFLADSDDFERCNGIKATAKKTGFRSEEVEMYFCKKEFERNIIKLKEYLEDIQKQRNFWDSESRRRLQNCEKTLERYKQLKSEISESCLKNKFFKIEKDKKNCLKGIYDYKKTKFIS